MKVNSCMQCFNLTTKFQMSHRATVEMVSDQPSVRTSWWLETRSWEAIWCIQRLQEMLPTNKSSLVARNKEVLSKMAEAPVWSANSITAWLLKERLRWCAPMLATVLATRSRMYRAMQAFWAPRQLIKQSQEKTQMNLKTTLLRSWISRVPTRSMLRRWLKRHQSKSLAASREWWPVQVGLVRAEARYKTYQVLVAN